MPKYNSTTLFNLPGNVRVFHPKGFSLINTKIGVHLMDGGDVLLEGLQ
jgi:hypothetical protein